jgi:hypothetical protein
MRTVVLVPGHGVFLPTTSQEPSDTSLKSIGCDSVLPSKEQLDRPEYWHIDSFQRGEEPQFVMHVRAAVQRALDVQLSCLADSVDVIFSGGATRVGAGERTEARGYLDIARILFPNVAFRVSSLGLDSSVHTTHILPLHSSMVTPISSQESSSAPNESCVNVILEEFARDSLENVAYALTTFSHIRKGPPSTITVICISHFIILLSRVWFDACFHRLRFGAYVLMFLCAVRS